MTAGSRIRLKSLVYFRSHPQRRHRSSKPSINQAITAPVVRVITQDGRGLPPMTISQALGVARTAGLDLVEVAPNADPPVCRLLDARLFGPPDMDSGVPS